MRISSKNTISAFRTMIVFSMKLLMRYSVNGAVIRVIVLELPVKRAAQLSCQMFVHTAR